MTTRKEKKKKIEDDDDGGGEHPSPFVEKEEQNPTTLDMMPKGLKFNFKS
jgi:hypothetical protein